MLLVFVFGITLVSCDFVNLVESGKSHNGHRHAQIAFNCTRASWDQFKISYKKRYQDVADDRDRFLIYCNNLRVIYEHNAQHGRSTYSMAVNQFADRTEEELIGGRKLRKLEDVSNEIRLINQERNNHSGEELPAHWDWSEDPKVVSPARMQGNCGSCWAFATIGMIEGQERPKKGETLTMLSEQNLIDCNETGDGCEGGESVTALVDVKRMGGLMRLEDYPYISNVTMRRQECRMDKSKIVPFTSQFGDITKLPFGDEEYLKRKLVEYGPIMVQYHTVMAFYSYSEGVFHKQNCPVWGNHILLIVGYGTDSHGQDYWKVKNSWDKSGVKKGSV